MASTRSVCRLGYVDETTREQTGQGVCNSRYLTHVSLWIKRTEHASLLSRNVLQETRVEHGTKCQVWRGNNEERKLRERSRALTKVSIKFSLPITIFFWVLVSRVWRYIKTICWWFYTLPLAFCVIECRYYLEKFSSLELRKGTCNWTKFRQRFIHFAHTILRGMVAEWLVCWTSDLMCRCEPRPEHLTISVTLSTRE